MYFDPRYVYIVELMSIYELIHIMNKNNRSHEMTYFNICNLYCSIVEMHESVSNDIFLCVYWACPAPFLKICHAKSCITPIYYSGFFQFSILSAHPRFFCCCVVPDTSLHLITDKKCLKRCLTKLIQNWLIYQHVFHSLHNTSLTRSVLINVEHVSW